MYTLFTVAVIVRDIIFSTSRGIIHEINKHPVCSEAMLAPPGECKYNCSSDSYRWALLWWLRPII